MKRLLYRVYNKFTDRKKTLPFCDVKAFCEKWCFKYSVIDKEKECEELRPLIWQSRAETSLIKRMLSETYVAQMTNATIFGDNDLVMCKNTILDDMLTCDFAAKMNHKKGIKQSVDVEHSQITIQYHNYRHLPIRKAISLIGKFSYSYYHFLIDLLPKLFYFYQLEEYRDYPILVDTRAYQNFKEIIDFFNIYNNRIICINSGVAYKVKELIVASNCAWYDRYVLEDYHKDAGHVFDGNALAFIRNHALKAVQNNGKIEKVYISRAKQPEERRRLLHEDKVEKLLNAAGFVTVYPEELSFFEQVNLFSQVKAVFGVTGAAFTNVIFMPEDATIIYATCMCGNRGENLFPSLWHTVGKGDFFILQGIPTKESEGQKDNLKNFELDLKSFESLLNSL